MMKEKFNKIFQKDCIEGMKLLQDKSIDMILTDLPYGTTQCKWDTMIPLQEMWIQFNRIIKDNCPIVLTSMQPFTTTLISSNIKNFKYSWVYEKSKATGYLNAKKRPLNAHEDVLVFCNTTPKYFPQMTQGEPYNKGKALRPTDVYGKQVATLVKNDDGTRYPRSVQYFKTAESEGKVIHPTQKPLALFEYLIKTYTNEDDIVLDCCMGSGTTAIASIKNNRKFVGFEIDENYNISAVKRIQELLPDFQITA